MVDLNKALEKYELPADTLCLIDMYATWCGPCKQQAYIIDLLQKELQELHVLKIDIEKDMLLTKELKVMGVPYLYLVKNGKLLWKAPGVLSLETLRNQIEIYA